MHPTDFSMTLIPQIYLQPHSYLCAFVIVKWIPLRKSILPQVGGEISKKYAEVLVHKTQRTRYKQLVWTPIKSCKTNPLPLQESIN